MVSWFQFITIFNESCYICILFIIAYTDISIYYQSTHIIQYDLHFAQYQIKIFPVWTWTKECVNKVEMNDKKSRSYSKDCMIKLCLCLYMLQCTNINLINSCILWLNFWEKKLPYLFEIFKVDEMKKMSTFPL